ncbi:dTDP-4-dehydrorhamnose reductase [Rhodococcus sp. HNM0569]|uniref:dTDP-4-dehydrorhamnose reductase n=1 Tax=Rhodococcus sp. HNM0569 TaxID=2716340 RepID=UPI001469F1B3|nr:dTDP-4-dehydrorhamnose reductase [Rhodococcus sp. HNM0569]
MNRILVTGAAGQLGTAVVDRARRGGLDVDARTSRELDVTDPAAVRDAVAAGTVVVNCAAYTAVDAAETDEDAARRVNADGPGLLAAACAAAGARLVHVSTDYVFGGDARAAYDVADSPAPQTAYGRTKLAGERAVHAALPSATIVRTAWVYTGTGTDFVATMLRLERERETVNVVADQVGAPTYTGDLADGLLEIVARDAPPPLLHFTNSGRASWYDLARAVFEEAGADPTRVVPCTSAEFVRPAPRPAFSVLSLRAWQDAGFTPPRAWRTALHEALR